MPLTESERQLFSKVRELCESGWHDLPDTGSGAAGNYLETVLGGGVDNMDAPDIGRREIKFSSGTALLTLFHLTPKPKDCVMNLIRQFGWTGKNNGRPSFRHTIHGRSDKGFRVVHEKGAIWITHPDMRGEAPHWTEDDLLGSVGSKLRRLLLVRGKRRKNGNQQQVSYRSAEAFQQFRLSGLMDCLVDGLVAVDFDAYEKENGTVRDHGTKFRIKPKDIGGIYEKSSDIFKESQRT